MAHDKTLLRPTKASGGRPLSVHLRAGRLLGRFSFSLRAPALVTWLVVGVARPLEEGADRCMKETRLAFSPRGGTYKRPAG